MSDEPDNPTPAEVLPAPVAPRGLTDARSSRAWALFAAGWRPDAIAAELRISPATVKGYLAAHGASSRAMREALGADYIERELAGLDNLERTILEDAAAAPPGIDGLQAHAIAARIVLEIKARRAKMLGLDKPQEIKTTVTLEELLTRSQAPG